MDGFFVEKSGKDYLYNLIQDEICIKNKCAKYYVNKLWEVSCLYLGDDLRSAAQDQFHQCFWEMYLVSVLLDLGLPLLAQSDRRCRGEGPDIQIGSNPSAWIEAIAPTRGDGQDAVPGHACDKVVEVPDEQFKLRLTAAISEKFRKYEKYTNKGIVSESEPFVIAINVGSIPYRHQELNVPRVVSVLYGIGSQVVHLDPSTMQSVGSSYSQQSHVQKNNGVQIPATFFQGQHSCGISGILYSTVDPWNRPTRLGSDFLFIHNKNARNPLPCGFLKVGRECYVEGDQLTITPTRAGQPAR